jgi:hypothetical protein
MSLRSATICCLALTFLGSAATARDKNTAQIRKLGDVAVTNIAMAPSLASADTCYVDNNEEIVTRIDGWVIGYELYKSLLDPEERCENPYPFTVTGINMPMMFDAGTPITVSVDVEAVDVTTLPGCPLPGVLLAISSDWELTVPDGGGFFNIWVPLDTPVTVDGPFFAGFYIGSAIDPSVNAAVVIDSFPVPCATFNIWDESIGWVDLTDNPYFSFPGRLGMQASGIPGGSGGPSDTVQLVMLAPSTGDVLYGSVGLWAFDSAATGTVEYVSFEYSNGGAFVEIGRDFDGTSPLRNGVDPSVAGTGFSIDWDFSFLPEGNYTIRATAVDTAGHSSSVAAAVFLEPTPPRPRITHPTNGAPFCTPLDIEMTTDDEDLVYVEIYYRNAQSLYSQGLSPMSQFVVGDNNGNPSDGNSAYAGEFGDYYSAPTSAAVAIKLWYDRGYTNIMKNSGGTMTIEEMTEVLAADFHVRQNLGAYDEAVYSGLVNYNVAHGGDLEFDYMRDPSYFDVRTWVEDEERSVMIGIGGVRSLWVAIDGLVGWKDADESYRIIVANPLTGGLQVMKWRHQAAYSELDLGLGWQKVDIMISMIARGWYVSRPLVGVDFHGGDGWSYTWAPSELADGSVSFIRAIGRDATDYRASDVVISRYDCASVYVSGDYNDDRATDIADLVLLIDFIALESAPPNGGASRADANCDSVVNIADIVYYMNYLFGAASPPCR